MLLNQYCIMEEQYGYVAHYNAALFLASLMYVSCRCFYVTSSAISIIESTNLSISSCFYNCSYIYFNQSYSSSFVCLPMTFTNYYAVMLLKGAYITLLITQLRVMMWSLGAAHIGVNANYLWQLKTPNKYSRWVFHCIKNIKCRNISKCILYILS